MCLSTSTTITVVLIYHLQQFNYKYINIFMYIALYKKFPRLDFVTVFALLKTRSTINGQLRDAIHTHFVTLIGKWTVSFLPTHPVFLLALFQRSERFSVFLCMLVKAIFYTFLQMEIHCWFQSF